jgi:tetratricopeptide (TPR) repeat protein/transglutaminase-like putative cysteine protease
MKATLFRCAPLLVLSAFTFGQSPTPPERIPIKNLPLAAPLSGAKDAKAARDYSSEPGVIQHLDRVYQVEADGTGWRLLTTSVKVQTEAAVKQFGVLSVSFASSSESVEILYARVRRADGTVVETPVSGAMEQADPVTQAAPFYSDLKQKQLPIRSLSVGDTLEWQAKITRTKAEAPGHFWGQETFYDDAVILSQSVELRVPKDAFVNVWSPTLKPTDTTAGGYRVLRWESSQLKPTVGKDADEEKEAKSKVVWTPEQELEVTQGKLPTIAWTNFKSWEEVGGWYRGLEKDRTAPDEEIKAKVAELTAGKTTEEEKVRAVYGYVATQIRYIGVAFGVGRYQPHRAEDVMQNRYGDCKDKHTLLASMLEVLGLHPDAVLIGAGIRFNEAVPSPAAFNHLITMVPVGGKEVWLDATAEVAPYQMLMYSIRDKQALVIPGTGVAMVERTPAKLPFAPYQTMHAEGSLDKDGTSNSRLSITFRGDDELLMRSVLRQLSAAQYDQVVQQMSRNLGYGGTTSHADVSRPDDTAEPLTISYDYKREKAGDWDNFRIIPQVAPVLLQKPDEKTPPVRAILLGVPRTETSTAEMKLPEGWGVELPEAVHQKSAYATYDETYRFEKGTLYTERRIEVLQDKVPVSDWKSYKKWADAIDLGNEQYVQLTSMSKASEGAGSTESTTVTVNNAEAQKLIQDAWKAVQQRDFDTARTKLDSAKKLNERQIWLWTAYGYLAFSQGEMTKAMEFYQQELKINPEQYAAYGMLSQVQMTMGRRKEAMETLKSWSAAQGDNTAPVLALMSLLLEDKKATEAVSVAESAIAKLPEDKKKDANLLIALGRAQMMAGEKEQGRATLLGVMQSTEDPLMMNNSAYELANAGLELPAAEKATRAALEKMEDESKTWTLDENPQMLVTKSRLIANTWDTMGWILYREGKLQEAEGYIAAAWRGDQSAEQGEHLAELLDKKGDKNAALSIYELADATISDYDAMGVKRAPGEKKVELERRVEGLRKAGVKPSPHEAHTLQELRTIQLGAAKGMSGTTEYRLLLSQGKVVRAEAVGSKTLEGGEERVKTLAVAGFWPAGSQAQLVRSGFLNCHANVCEVVLEP